MKEKTADIRTSGYAKVLNSADEMFKELGYNKLINTAKTRIQYRKEKYFNGYKIIITINFYLLDKNLSIQSYNDNIRQRVDTNFETEEMLAIEKFCEEQGWLDE